MKKTIIIISIVVFATHFAIAGVLGSATSTTAGNLKMNSGSLSTELNFTPFGTTPLTMDGLKVRYFLSDQLAVRLGLDINMFSANSKPLTAQGVSDKDKKSYFVFGFSPGVEMHLADFEKLDPYIGAEVGFSMKSSKEEYTDNTANKTYKSTGAWGDGSNQAYGSFHVGVLAGVNKMLTKHMYFGAEMGFGFFMDSYKEVKYDDVVVENKSSQSSVQFINNGAIRLGWCFN